MPLGDSITYGTDDTIPANPSGGYRPYLATLLPTCTFVGSQTLTGKHEGHPSFTSANDGTGILGNIATWYAANPAQIVLLHIGTNDRLLGANDAASAALSASNVAAICDYIHAQSPSAHIFHAGIINARSDQVTNNAFFDVQRPAAAAAVVGKSWVHQVTMPTLVDADFSDGVHPSSAVGKGYSKMATAWYAAIVAAMA